MTIVQIKLDNARAELELADEVFEITKICTKCNGIKPKSEFHKQTRMRDGLRSICKECTKAAGAVYRTTNPEKTKAKCAAWRAANPEKAKSAAAAYRAANTGSEKARHAAYRSVNRDKRKAKSSAWYAENRDKAKAYSVANHDKYKAAWAAWRVANADKKKAYSAAYHAANPEAGRIKEQNRRARKRENGGELSKGLSAKLFKLQRGKCACCGLPLGDNYHMDHRMPLALGGSNTDSNIQLLRPRCNQQKNAKHPIEFMQSRGFLL